MPLPGLTGPFELAPVNLKVAAAAGTALLKSTALGGTDEYAMTDFFNKHRANLLTRTGKDIVDIMKSQKQRDGTYLVRRGEQAYQYSSMGEMVGNIFLPGTPIKKKAIWKAVDRGYRRSEISADKR